jgi:hypothetical protein
MPKIEIVQSERETEPTEIFRVLFKDGTGIVFTIFKTDGGYVREFLETLDENSTVYVVEKYLRSQGFSRVADDAGNVNEKIKKLLDS